MTSIAPRIKKILAIVEELKEAITNKGVDVPETALFPELPDYIKQIVTLDFDFTEIITDYFGQITDEIPDTIYSSSGFSGTITDSQILFNTSGFTIVGSPSVSNDSLISDFSTSSYLTLEKSDIFVSSDPEYTMEMRFKTGSSTAAQNIWHGEYGCNLEINSSNVLICYSWSKGSSYTIYTVEADTWYVAVLTRSLDDNTKTYNLYSDNKAELLATVTITDTSVNFSNTSYGFYLGLSSYYEKYPFLGTIDINNTYINNTTDGIYWQPSVTVEDLTL